MLTEDDLIHFALSMPGACVRYPYGDAPLVLSTADVHEFGELYEGTVPIHIVLKSTAEESERLRAQYPDHIKPGYRCPKRTWNSLYIDGTVPDETVLQMIRFSYELTAKTKKKRPNVTEEF